jgi:hypothetical protein
MTFAPSCTRAAQGRRYPRDETRTRGATDTAHGADGDATLRTVSSSHGRYDGSDTLMAAIGVDSDVVVTEGTRF